MKTGTDPSGKVLHEWDGPGIEPCMKIEEAASTSVEPYDVAIVGAGVVGCALAYRLSQYQLRTVLVDRCHDVGEGSSKANSAIVHTGFDATPGSLESALVTKASRYWPEMAGRLKIPMERCGALLVAVDAEQGALLQKIYRKALDNGVNDVKVLSPGEVRALEPNAVQTNHGGILIERESIADPFSTSIAYAEVAVQNGVDILLGVRIAGIEDPGAPVKTLVSDRGKKIRARIVVNAAGLGSRAIADLYTGAPFDINPRRGQFLVFDRFSNPLIKRILLPVPTAQTKGILVTRSIFGNLIAGPTAEDLPLGAADHDCTTRDGLRLVREGASKLLPSLGVQPLIGTHAGSRCNCAQGSYILRYNDGHDGIVSLIGIRSTGFTASPTLAEHVAQGIFESCGLKPSRKSAFTDSRPETAWPGWWKHPHEDPAAIAAKPDYGRIVCMCENISRAEITDALDSALKPRTLDAVKRRTRAMTGRCQSFECQILIAEIISAHTGIPLGMITKKGPGSELAP